jgi:hypothetical protein
MGDLPPEYWEIVPVDHIEKPIVKTNQSSAPIKSINRIVIEEPVVKPRHRMTQTTINQPTSAQVNPPAVNSSQELQKLADDYPLGSIEKRLIENIKNYLKKLGLLYLALL